MNSLSIPVHLLVIACTAQRQLLLETAENRTLGTEIACCTEVLFTGTFQFDALLIVTLNKQKSAIKSRDKKSARPLGSPIFCRGFFEVWQGRTKFCQSETRRSHSSTTLVDSFFLQSKQKFCLVRPAPQLNRQATLFLITLIVYLHPSRACVFLSPE